jgi:16S rRNA (adenine1518-N6/adenine1519-N6)-dimethyltransferase
VTTRDRPPEPGAADFAAILRRHAIRPDKRLGQHFLFDPTWLQRIVDAASLQGTETVLEIGAGVGSLTRCLALHAGLVVAVEIDRKLIPALEHALEGVENVKVVQGDILALGLRDLVGEASFSVVANIPYQITSMLVRRLLEAPRPPDRLVLTVQREVAERIVAGEGEMSLLALGVQLYGSARIVGRIPPGAFYPPPEVDSAILRVDLYASPRIDPGLIPVVFEVARLGFSQRRKKLRNSLAAGLNETPRSVAEWLEEAGVAPGRRAQQLRLEDWERIARVVERRRRNPGPGGISREADGRVG